MLALALAVLFGASAFLPRWWSHRIADQANGSFTSGIGLGLFYGFAFTFLALVVLWLGLRRITSWKGRLIVLGVALLVASPNLLTLGIVLGPGGAAHAGERTLDVEAPGFRASSLIGAIVAVLVVAVDRPAAPFAPAIEGGCSRAAQRARRGTSSDSGRVRTRTS